MVVSLKKLLNAGSLQLCDMLKHLFRVCIFPLTVCVLGIKVILGLGWNKGCLHTFGVKSLPIEANKPWMLFKHLRTFFSKSVARLSLNKSVDKVGSLRRPAGWNLILMDLDLL